MSTRIRLSERARERAIVFGFFAGCGITSFAWWVLLRALEVLA